MEAIVENLGRRGRLGEVVPRRGAQPLDLDGEGANDVLLCCKLGERCALARELAAVQRDRPLLTGCRGPEDSHCRSAVVCMVGSELEPHGHGVAGAPEPLADALDDECAGVMIGMTAFVGMCDHRRGAAQLCFQDREQLRQVIDGLLIRYPQRAAARRDDLGRRQRPIEL